MITVAMARAGWRDSTAAPTVVKPATANWLAPKTLADETSDSVRAEETNGIGETP
jgi:hypothetical protein